MNKIFIVPYFGQYPEWFSKYKENIEGLKQYGWHWMFPSEDLFMDLAGEKLGLVPKIKSCKDLRKIGDLHPMMGVMFEDYIKDYDFWGNTDLDVVYGRLDRYYTDMFLSDCDIYGDDPNALCGCMTLYRNTPKVNKLFMEDPNWENVFATDEYYAYDEIGMTNLVRKHRDKVRFKSGHNQQYDPNDDSHIVLREDGTLLDRGNEICIFHFNRTKRYPI